MNRNFPAYKDDEGFRRIAVLLLSLAALAEQAALRSRPIRFLVLWLLRPAEEAAWGLATEAGYAVPPLFQPGSLAPSARGAGPGLVPGEAERGRFADADNWSDNGAVIRPEADAGGDPDE